MYRVQRAGILLATTSLLLAGCNLADPKFFGASCATDTDCPSSFKCVTTPRATGKTCEAKFEVRAKSQAQTEYFCKRVKPALDKYCNGCHGATPAGGAPASFRLDVYATVGTTLGAKDQAERSASRMFTSRTMPPASWPAQPTDEERKMFDDWNATGAKDCDTATAAGGLSQGLQAEAEEQGGFGWGAEESP